MLLEASEISFDLTSQMLEYFSRKPRGRGGEGRGTHFDIYGQYIGIRGPTGYGVFQPFWSFIGYRFWPFWEAGRTSHPIFWE